MTYRETQQFLIWALNSKGLQDDDCNNISSTVTFTEQQSITLVGPSTSKMDNDDYRPVGKHVHTCRMIVIVITTQQ